MALRGHSVSLHSLLPPLTSNNNLLTSQHIVLLGIMSHYRNCSQSNIKMIVEHKIHEDGLFCFFILSNMAHVLCIFCMMMASQQRVHREWLLHHDHSLGEEHIDFQLLEIMEKAKTVDVGESWWSI